MTDPVYNDRHTKLAWSIVRNTLVHLDKYNSKETKYYPVSITVNMQHHDVNVLPGYDARKEPYYTYKFNWQNKVKLTPSAIILIADAVKDDGYEAFLDPADAHPNITGQKKIKDHQVFAIPFSAITAFTNEDTNTTFSFQDGKLTFSNKSLTWLQSIMKRIQGIGKE